MTEPRGDALFRQAIAADADGRHAQAVIALREAADAKHVASMTFLGGRLLVGRGASPDPAKGARLILDAAGLGGAEACALAANLAGAGAGMRQDWSLALDYLERAAGLGSVKAQDQLRVLAGAIGPEPEQPGLWRRLRRSVNVRAWCTPPPRRAIAESPRVRCAERFAPAHACDWLIARAKTRVRPAQVYDPASGGPRQEGARSNSAVAFDIAQADLVLLMLRERVAAVTRTPVLALEPPQVLHYATGQSFAPHFDFLDPAVEGYARDVALRGQRVATLLVYLNDDYAGGETHFPLIDLRHRGRKGDALFFANVDRENAPDRRTLHAGEPPTAGEKWLLSQWIRDRVPTPPAPAAGDPNPA